MIHSLVLVNFIMNICNCMVSKHIFSSSSVDTYQDNMANSSLVPNTDVVLPFLFFFFENFST